MNVWIRVNQVSYIEVRIKKEQPKLTAQKDFYVIHLVRS